LSRRPELELLATFTCRRHVAADDALWQVVHDRMGELMRLAMATVAVGYRLFDIHPPFGIDPDEMSAYAADKLTRRLGAIESARGADLRLIDRDASPEALEEKFHAEDQLTLTG
jgi:ribonucleoside-diphosphate reductase beta chain